MFGGSGLGKSLSAAREAELFLMASCLTKTPIECWIVGPKYVLAEKEFRYIWEDMLVTYGLMKDSKARCNVSNGDLYIRFPWGAQVIGKSEEVPDTLLGEAVHILILAEGARLKSETYSRYLRRAVDRGNGIVICNTTPRGYNWVYDTFYMPYVHGNPWYWAGIYDVIENPYYDRESYESAKKDLPPEIFQEQYEGKFVQYSGLIYPEFDYKRHMIDLDIPELPREWPIICLIDTHPETPTAVTWYMRDDEGCHYFIDELWMRGLISDMCDVIRQKSREHNRVPYWFVIDCSDKADVRTGINILQEYRKHLQHKFPAYDIICKMPDPRAKRQEKYGWIFRIKELFKGTCEYGGVSRYKPKLSKPWINIDNRCRQLRYELEHECWTEKGEVPLTGVHFLDLIKYAIAENLEHDIRPRTQIWNYRLNKYRGEPIDVKANP